MATVCKKYLPLEGHIHGVGTKNRPDLIRHQANYDDNLIEHQASYGNRLTELEISSSSRSGLIPAGRAPGSVPDSDTESDSCDDDNVVTSDRDDKNFNPESFSTAI